MHNLKTFFSPLFSKAMLAFLAIVALGLAVWFLGPWLAFGAHHPLGDLSLRVTAIVMLVALYVCWLRSWPYSPLAVAALCVLLWHLGPLLAFGEVRPLASYGTRTICIVLIVIAYGVYGAWRLWGALRNNEALVKRIFGSSDDAAARPREELHVLGAIVGKAVQHIRRIHGHGLGLKRYFESDRQLYDLPWFMMLGTPEAGKTIAALNSGLEFPEADQMNAVSLKAPEGTTYCDWWFTNEAVLIDTAGRYADHRAGETEDPERNKTEWMGFLGLLRKHRPRAPVNGVVLALSASELLGKSPDERIALAATLRTRLTELRQELGIRFPVYVLVTKVDVLPGFGEYFQSLTAEGRAQVWGIAVSAPEDGAARRANDLRERCVEEIGVLVDRLEAGVNNRLIEEYETERRKRLYALPAEFGCLAGVVLDVVSLVFMDSRYDSTQIDSALRGVYFSSAMQSDVTIAADKTTLLQRLRGGAVRSVPGDAGAEAEAERASGAETSGYRSYFLHNLFQQVIVPEAHLVRPNLRWELRFRAATRSSWAASWRCWASNTPGSPWRAPRLRQTACRRRSTLARCCNWKRRSSPRRSAPCWPGYRSRSRRRSTRALARFWRANSNHPSVRRAAALSRASIRSWRMRARMWTSRTSTTSLRPMACWTPFSPERLRRTSIPVPGHGATRRSAPACRPSTGRAWSRSNGPRPSARHSSANRAGSGWRGRWMPGWPISTPRSWNSRSISTASRSAMRMARS